MNEIRTIWVRESRLITAWDMGGWYEVTVLDATKMAFLDGYERRFADPIAAVDYATGIAHYFERISTPPMS